MGRKIAIEASLHDYIDFFEESGYEVNKILGAEDAGNIQSSECDAVIISDTKDGSLELSTFLRSGGPASAPVIDATGKTPEEIFDMLGSEH
ncbi:MAG: YkuS family protein [Candidatus Alkaliphilus sp. MAG34]|nr:hypothetical protein [Clostridiales bacterium]